MTPRRTQADRTATTRAALMQATVDALVEVGFTRATTTEVAQRAGVSLGALVHHFPTKADLLCAAVAHLFRQRDVELRAAAGALPPGPARHEAAIDLLWSAFQGPTFVAWLELWVAARTDPELCRAVVQLDAEFMTVAEASFAALFPDETATDADLPRKALNVVFGSLEGLALSRLLPGYQPSSPETVLAVLKQLLPAHLATAERTAP